MASTINASTTSGLVQTADTSGVLQFQTANTTAVTVNASQNVGVGTSSPTVLLDVASQIAYGVGGTNAGISLSGPVDQYPCILSSGYGGTIDYESAQFLVTRARGTKASPTATASGDYLGSIGFRGWNATLNGYSGSGITCIQTAATTSLGNPSALTFSTCDGVNNRYGNERMRVDSSGFLNINTTAPFTSSNSYINILTAAATNFGITIKDSGTTYAATTKYMNFLNSADAVAGSIQHTAATTTAYATSSDERLKENIVDAPSALSLVKQIPVRSYDWKEDGSHVEFGFVAQELHNVYAEPVGVGGEDVNTNPWNIEYGRLTPILLKAIQEQQTIINDLKARIEILEGAK